MRKDDTSHYSTQEKRQRQKVEHQGKLDRGRRYSFQIPPAFWYLLAYDDLENDLWYVEPINIGSIIPSELLQG